EDVLVALQANLPQREQTLTEYRRLAVDLHMLEELEEEAKALHTKLQSHEQALADYDQLHAEWTAGETEAQRLSPKKAQEDQAFQSARMALEGREKATLRDGRLSLLLQHIVHHEQALTEADTLAEELKTAQTHADSLDTERERLSHLEQAEQWQERI